MSISPFDSTLHGDLFGDIEIARLFSDTAEVRAMMLVFGALAKVQGEAGVIPETSGAFLHRAAMEIQVDPSGLAEATGQNGVTVPGLVAAMRKAFEAPEHAAYLHWGATSQDIQDTGLMLRLRQALILIEGRVSDALNLLADLAEAHAETVMAARTYGQVATPSSFGVLLANWGWPLLDVQREMRAVLAQGLPVSLAGAAGTATMLGPSPADLRARLAAALGLHDPGRSWHAERRPLVSALTPLGALTSATGKIGEDLLLLSRSEIGEIQLSASGASSTMPQKQNPVGPSVLVALSRFAAAQMAGITATPHREARDGAAWFTEWLMVPSLIAAAAKSAAVLVTLTAGMKPNEETMAARAQDPLGLIQAEALSFALTSLMPRPEAQALVKSLARSAQESGTPLPDLVVAAHPGFDRPDPLNLGQAPMEARAFARAVRDAAQG